MVKNGRVTAVISLQSDEEMEQRGINEYELKTWYQKLGIKSYVRVPVNDDNLNKYIESNF